ncbi:hypothetical protein ACFQ1S_10440 [Kibdelosporangium lantanae]|uniref:Uncharacterized protein n=1 Tax=Kibdelosporangium lantanae TaxID=1497396 RepID=A0ABW3M5H2_9PSEU
MDDGFTAMVIDVEQRHRQHLPLGPSAVQHRSRQLLDNVCKMVEVWNSKCEAEIEQDVGSSDVRDIISAYCGEAQYAVLMLWLHCCKHVTTGSHEFKDFCDALAMQHRLGMADSAAPRSTPMVGVWIRQLLSAAIKVSIVVPWRSGGSAEDELDRGSKLLEIQRWLSAYVSVCGADVVRSTRPLLTREQGRPS